MNRFTHEFHTTANEIRLTGAERRRVQASLRAAMRTAPVPSPFFSSSLLFPRFVMAALALILVLGGLGGTAFAAAGALPGDLLYPVKVGVAEPVEGALAFSAGAKAKWNAKVAETRLDEAQALAAKGELDATTSAELAANFTSHANEVQAADAPAFSSLITAKSSAILTASEASGNASTTRASGSLVLAIADHDQSGDARTSSTFSASNAAPEPTPAPALSKKMAVPMMMAFSAPAEDTSATASEDDAMLLASLSVEAHDALAAATSTVSSTVLDDSLGQEASIRIASLAKLVVRAEAERAVGSTTEAIADFNQALKDAADFQLFIENGGAPPEESDADQPPLPTLTPFPI